MKSGTGIVEAKLYSSTSLQKQQVNIKKNIFYITLLPDVLSPDLYSKRKIENYKMALEQQKYHIAVNIFNYQNETSMQVNCCQKYFPLFIWTSMHRMH